MAPLVRFDDVSKRFGRVAAVERVSLDIEHGEFFALLGPSGCGKTTLLRLLGGFETPDGGRVMLGDADVTRVPPHRRPVNMMFQNYALFPHLTVAGNVAFGLRQERLPRAEIEARVREMLALVKLDGLDARKPHELSGGQSQRVALARALAKRPKVLLLDEQMAALDKKLREETQLELMQLRERLGLTFLIVTHDQDEAMTVASRIAVMNDGRIAQVGTPFEIYECPNSRWVAQFVGDVNLIEEPGGLYRGWLALRPERVRIGAATGKGHPGVILAVGYRGDLTLYRVGLDSGGIVKASVANSRGHADSGLRAGERVCLHWDAGDGTVLTR